MRVVLTKKLADAIDGIDLSSRKVGDLLDLPSDEASLILAENWAIADRRASVRSPRTDHNKTPDTHPVEPASSAPRATSPRRT